MAPAVSVHRSPRGNVERAVRLDEPRRPRGRRSCRGRENSLAPSRQRLGSRRPATWVRPLHVHGTTCRRRRRVRPRPEATGSATTAVGLPLVALGADCAPIALANDTAVAAIHAAGAGAGRRGRCGRRGGAPAGPDGSAPFGPCICVRHYEFGADAARPLTTRLGPEVAGTTVDGRPALDFRSALRRRSTSRGRRDQRRRRVHRRVGRPLLVPPRWTHRTPGRRRGEAADEAASVAGASPRCASGSPAAARAGRARPRMRLDRRDQDRGRRSARRRDRRRGSRTSGREPRAGAPGQGAGARGPRCCPPAWHFIGRLQRNKVTALVPWVTSWDSVDRLAVGEAIARRAPGARVLVEVNLAVERRRRLHARRAGGLVEALRALDLDVDGLDDGAAHGRATPDLGLPRSVTSRRHSNCASCRWG